MSDAAHAADAPGRMQAMSTFVLAHRVEKVRVDVGGVAAFGPSAPAVEHGESCRRFSRQRHISLRLSSKQSWLWAPSVETWGQKREAVDEDDDSCVADD